jgi:hypothetical protein
MVNEILQVEFKSAHGMTLRTKSMSQHLREQKQKADWTPSDGQAGV